MLLIGVDDGSTEGRTPVLMAAAAYLVVALPGAVLAGLRRQRVTNRWLMARRSPTSAEAAHALRLPVDTALVAGVVWSVAAAVIGTVSAVAFPDARVGLRTGIATLLGGIATAGVTYLLVARAARAVTATALAAHPPAGALTLGRAPAAAADLGAHQRRPDARRRIALPRPEQSGRPRRGGRRLPGDRLGADRRPGHAAHRPRGRAAAAGSAGGG